jgi:STE24 endopeptidase
MANEDKATRYHRLRRRASFAGTALTAVCFVVLLVTGWSASLRDISASVSGGVFLLTVIVYVTAIGLLIEVIQLPLAFYQGVVLERRYELSTQTTWRWAGDQIKATAVGLLFGAVGALIVWTSLRSTPGWWWLVTALCFVVLVVVLAQLAPVVLLPLFYKFKPLDRPALVERLVALAGRAGARVLGVFEWQLSDRTRKANAALTGIGRTRRILLSDTLLAAHSDDEIEVVLAHELAHHVYHDIWTSIALEASLITLAFYVADLGLSAVVGHFGVVDKADVAALPALVLAGGAVSLILLPLANAVSRSHERRADRYALDMTKNADAFTSAMKRLGAQNLAEERPSRLIEILFHSHPPIAARLEAARAWQSAQRN